MAQMAVYANPHAHSKKTFPLLIDVQSDLLRDLNTCVVVPLILAKSHPHQHITRLTPEIDIAGSTYRLVTHQIAGIARRDLGTPVADASAYRSEVIAALDFLISGF